MRQRTYSGKRRSTFRHRWSFVHNWYLRSTENHTFRKESSQMSAHITMSHHGMSRGIPNWRQGPPRGTLPDLFKELLHLIAKVHVLFRDIPRSVMKSLDRF